MRVWGPRAGEIQLLIRGVERVALARENGGWWSTSVAVPAGEDYAWVVDGRRLPDPRSPWQPNGVHGDSRQVDHAAYAWRVDRWSVAPLSTAVFYEVHVGTFTPAGTFEGAISRLDHLTDLGVTHLEIMPVAEFPGQRGWGYDGVALFAPKHGYGGPDGLKRLVDACHERGLAVILDVVYNHLGPDGNHLGRFGPYFTDAYATPWGQAVNLDGPGSDEVRRFLLDNARMWLRDYRMDGLRLDAVHALYDRSATHLLEEMALATAELEQEVGRPLVLVAESDLNDPRLVTERARGGHGLHSHWSDDFHHALHAFVTGERDGYYGDFASPFPYFTDHRDPELARAVTDGRRHEFASFGWGEADVPDPQADGTFESARLRWSEREAEPHRRLLAWHRSLIALRRTRPWLQAADPSSVRVELEEERRLLLVRRERTVVACNFSDARQRTWLPEAGSWQVLQASDRPVLRGRALDLAPGVAILET